MSSTAKLKQYDNFFPSKNIHDVLCVRQIRQIEALESDHQNAHAHLILHMPRRCEQPYFLSSLIIQSRSCSNVCICIYCNGICLSNLTKLYRIFYFINALAKLSFIRIKSSSLVEGQSGLTLLSIERPVRQIIKKTIYNKLIMFLCFVFNLNQKITLLHFLYKCYLRL